MPHRTLQEEERSLWTLFGTFFKIGLFTFGGGYAMIALLENEFITKKHWLGRDEFLDMAAIAESTPGPVAINSATYLGYKLAGGGRGHGGRLPAVVWHHLRHLPVF